MIVVDTSAVIAVLWEEVGSARYLDAINAADAVVVGAPNALEVYMVATGRYGVPAGEKALVSLQALDIRIAAFTPTLVGLAGQAFERFGKGRNKAGLNYGDCMSYALAKSLDAPLLYKGNDFALTDLRSVVTV